MESGINAAAAAAASSQSPGAADQNFYADYDYAYDARRPGDYTNSHPASGLTSNLHSPPPSRPKSTSTATTTSPQPQLRLLQRTYDPPPLPDFDARSPHPSHPHPQLPPKLPFLTTANLHAATANGYTNPPTGASPGLTDGGDPAEFYREYRGVQHVQQPPNGYTDTNTTSSSTTNGMAMPDSRPTPSSLRSNGNGTTARHPSIPARGVKQSYRSASSPLDDRMPLSSAKSSPALNGMPKTGQSVKDLLKRFDQNNEQTSSIARKPSPRVVTKEGASGSTSSYRREGTAYVGRTTGNSSNPPSTSRAGTTTREGIGRKSPEKSRTTQRTRFATEDQHSNNTQSSVPRSARLRNLVSASTTTPQASKSMTNLSPTSPISKPSRKVSTPASRLLFGQVDTAQGPGSDYIAYGIPSYAKRRTSESNLHPSWQRQRSRSEVEISPSSSTAWYLGVTPALDDVDPNQQLRSVHGHNRNHSDFQDTKANIMIGVTPDFESPVLPTPPKKLNNHPPHPPHPLQSRLPISSKRLSESSGSSSPTSPRANSPFTAKPYSNGKPRRPEQRPWSPAVRESANTPTQRSPRGKARKAEPAPNGASLQAFIAPLPPKTSPPLRSSRPRQPVSSASTNSPRQTPQPVRTGMKITRNNGPPGFDNTPPRKIVDTPVDFEGLRKGIRRAYTKSIHESEQKLIRAENLRRLSERTTTARDSLEGKGKEPGVAYSRPETPPPPVPTIDPQAELRESPLSVETTPKSPAPLQISTSFFKDESPLERVKMPFEDSPTLGMPGTFIDDEEPASAISNTTDIENEAQTEAARLRRLPSTKRREPSRLSSNVTSWADELSPEQAMYGITQEQESIDIMLALTPVEEAKPGLAKAERDPSPPGAFEEAEEQPRFATTLTTASPEAASPAQSRPPTAFESGDDQGSRNFEHPHNSAAGVTIRPELQTPPEISLPDEDEYIQTPDSIEAPRLHLPDLRTALAPPSVASNDGGNDYLNTPVTDMDYDSSDGAGATHQNEQEAYQRPYETTRDIAPSSHGYRSSHRSSWTDYSMDSMQEYSGEEDIPKLPSATLFGTEHKRLSPERSYSPTPPVPPKPEGYSPQPSPRLSNPSHYNQDHHQLPTLTTSDGFGFKFAEPTFTSSQLWPDHSPPPVPDLSFEASPVAPTRSPPLPGMINERPTSSVDQSSHNDTSQNTESRRPSDDVYSPRPSVSTPRSSTQISFEDVVATAAFGPKHAVLKTEAEQVVDKELTKRLLTRKHLIKELIDTEAVYSKDMNVVEEIYKGTAEACPKLEPGDIKTLFRNSHELVAFSTVFLDDLRSSAAPVCPPRAPKSKGGKTSPSTTASDRFSVATTVNDGQTDEQKDQRTFVGACFGRHMKQIQKIYTDFIKTQDVANSRLLTLQGDASVCVWLNECNTVAKDLTAAWDLDALLIKPFQRVTRYRIIIGSIVENTDKDHPDWPALNNAQTELSVLLNNINEIQKRIQMVGDIVKGRKRKESNVRVGIGKVFGQKSVKKEKEEPQTQPTITRDDEDPAYKKLHETYSDNYLRLQVVLRDVEFYVRQNVNHVNDDLRYKSAMELIMRLSASPWPEIESKWARFNMSMRDMGTVALDQHTAAIRTQVIEPFEKLIQLYGPAGNAMKKRSKRRAEYEKFMLAKKSGSKIAEKEQTRLDQYEALNETLKLELPQLFQKTQVLAQILLGNWVLIQAQWYDVWQKKVKVVLEESQLPKDVQDIVTTFNRDYKYVEGKAQELGIVNGSVQLNLERVASGGKASSDANDWKAKKETEIRKGRPSDLSSRSRGISFTSDKSPSLPTPDFAKNPAQFTFSPITATTPNIPQFAHQQSYHGQPYSTGHSRAGSGSPATPDARAYGQNNGRPSTSRSYTSEGMRMSNDYNTQTRRESGSTYNSHVDGPPISSRPYSGIFHSAMPLPDGPEDSARSSRASSRDRNVSGGYNVLYLAASLFEFNIAATKSEAGYPYLTYQAGEIFDVIGEKGELWLAKNQDDPSDQVGWIWSKHFARLATD
ncbi:Rho guanine nucleotide exchange factor gef1 [Lachnellula suecica]|uniref:Rho guanine nucleotide exchange factor gef1 n=1 Tax=Lachnellula suecica TaxID=602035 RepID=A0A8T9C1G2_9HELO|nr:Rho guanine nucleotide exchange factor gef1 [Lachnellula suecica]